MSHSVPCPVETSRGEDQRQRGKSCSPHKPWWGILGGLIFGLGLWVLVEDIEYWNTVWYVFAWYGYLLVLDGVLYFFQGHSFISHRRRELGAMLFWSVPFWFFFEVYNMVIKNWYYVFTPYPSGWTILFTTLSFATVLPACFVHAEFLKALGVGERLTYRPLNVEKFLIPFFFWFGLLCLILPLLWPRYAFWMVWGATLGIPDVINYRNGSPSLLRDLEAGKPGRIVRLLMGGMMAGLVWEGFNFWSRCKWIYTVPWMEDWKLFEMPLLGFIGFPFLALEAFAYYSLICHYLRGGRSWERLDSQRAHSIDRLRHTVFIVAILFFDLVVGSVAMTTNTLSRRPLLKNLTGLNETSIKKLHAAGIPTPERLYRAVQAKGLERLVQKTHIPRLSLREAYQETVLALHKGMGTSNARLLQKAGIFTIPELESANAKKLYLQLYPLALQSGVRSPRLAEIKVWIRAARLFGKTTR